MAFSLDPVEYFKKTSGIEDGTGGQFVPRGSSGMLNTARKYRSEFDDTSEYRPMLPGEDVSSSAATESLFGDQLKQNEQEYQLAASTLGYRAELDAAKRAAKAAKDAAEASKYAADRQASSNKTGAVIGAVGGIGSAVVGALI